VYAINICAPGYWDLYDSYGLIACQLARQLTGMGCYVNAYALGDTRFANQPADIKKMVSRPRRPSLGAVLMGYPTGYHRHGAVTAYGPRVALTMFESSKIPADWAPVLNRCDALVTTSHFGAELFRDCGVRTPSYVAPLGLSPIYQPRKTLNQAPLTFLAFLDRGSRKGGMLALNAFVRAFGDRRDVRLILKMRHQQYPLDLLNDNVTIIAQDMSEAALYQLYLSADVLIHPSTGEGFGLIPREFAATGGVALATNWSGTADDIDIWGVPLDYTLVPARWKTSNLKGQDLGEWAHVDTKYLAGVLRDVADRRDVYQMRAMRNAPHVGAMYDWRAFARAILGIWEGVLYGDRVAA